MPEEKGSTYCRCLYYSANALAREMTRMAEEEFAVVGLAPSTALILLAVQEKPGVQPKEIAAIMHLTPSTVTRLVDKLVARGYVRRRAAGKAIELSPAGKARTVYPKIREAWRNLYRRYSRVLGERQGQRLAAEVFGATQRLEASRRV